MLGARPARLRCLCKARRGPRAWMRPTLVRAFTGTWARLQATFKIHLKAACLVAQTLAGLLCLPARLLQPRSS